MMCSSKKKSNETPPWAWQPPSPLTSASPSRTRLGLPSASCLTSHPTPSLLLAMSPSRQSPSMSRSASSPSTELPQGRIGHAQLFSKISKLQLNPAHTRCSYSTHVPEYRHTIHKIVLRARLRSLSRSPCSPAHSLLSSFFHVHFLLLVWWLKKKKTSYDFLVNFGKSME